VLGNDSKILGNNSVVIGAGATAGDGGITIGYNSTTCNAAQINIGCNVNFTNSYAGTPAGFVLIGGCNNTLEQCSAWFNTNFGSVTIGYLNENCKASAGIVIGTCNSQYNTVNNNAPYNHSAIIGHCIKNYANYAYAFGSGLIICGTGTMTAGDQLTSVANYGQIFGLINTINTGSDFGSIFGSNNSIETSAVCGGVFGRSNIVCDSKSCSYAFGAGNVVNNNKAVAIGAGITTEKDNTTHVDNLIAFGQGASKYHDAGSITGNVTLNWDNGNNQSATLTGAVNLAFSNPISGANYSVKFIQDATGSRIVTFPAGMLWANSAPPVLSTAANAIDMISIVYDGTNYYGSWAVNFG
jgi:hypothetical protein